MRLLLLFPCTILVEGSSALGEALGGPICWVDGRWFCCLWEGKNFLKSRFGDVGTSHTAGLLQAHVWTDVNAGTLQEKMKIYIYNFLKVSKIRYETSFLPSSRAWPSWKGDK